MEKKTTTICKLTLKEIMVSHNVKGIVIGCGFNSHQIFYCPKCKNKLKRIKDIYHCPNCNIDLDKNHNKILEQKKLTIIIESKRK